MAKTDFNDGSTLTPAFMDLFHGTNASTGHAHDGLDADGSCPKIDPTSDITDFSFGSHAVKITTTYLTIEQTGNMYWAVIRDFVFISFSQMIGVSNSTDLQISINGVNWPAAILPATAQRANLIAHDNSKYTPGMIDTPASASADWILYMQDANHEFDANGFTAANNKGISETSFIYQVTN